MKLTRAAAALAATTAVVCSTALTAAAMTGGELDGERHPNVALIASYTTSGGGNCTATLVSETVLVTAAHCTAGTLGRTLVTFDSVVDEERPLDLPTAEDPSVGYTEAELEAAGYLAGTAHTHPQFSFFADTAHWNDVGVIVLDEPVTGIEPATIASANYLDQFSSNILSETLFTLVGYGTQVVKRDAGSRRPTPELFPLARRYAEAPGQKLTDQILQVNGNDKDPRGTGGPCFGDSGGPAFHGGYQVAVDSYVLTTNCRYLAGYQRLDIPEVQEWLTTFEVPIG
jgi:hypothetical protein